MADEFIVATASGKRLTLKDVKSYSMFPFECPNCQHTTVGISYASFLPVYIAPNEYPNCDIVKCLNCGNSFKREIKAMSEKWEEVINKKDS